MKRMSISAPWLRLLAGAVLASGAAAAVPAFAHHSFAMFDQDRTVQVKGTLKQLERANPHAWLKIVAPNKAGKLVDWSIEMGSVGQIEAMGLKAGALKPGDKLTVAIHPLRNGAIGGSFISAKTPDGREFIHHGAGTGEPGPPRPPGDAPVRQ
jgi:hypothetical protein